LNFDAGFAYLGKDGFGRLTAYECNDGSILFV